MTSAKITLCQEETRRIARLSDADVFLQVYSGGMRAALAQDDAWRIEPVMDRGYPCSKGFMSTARLQEFFHQYRFIFIAFQQVNWIKGDYHSSWSPFIPGQSTHALSPADLWSNIAGNLSSERTTGERGQMPLATHKELAALLDNHTEAERLARSISLSLRNMDISVEQIAEFYNEQLTNHLASGTLEGQRSSSTRDQFLFAHVHSFFMHLGAARDYISALCALGIGKDPQKIDSFAKLVGAVKSEHFARNNLIRLFWSQNYFRPKENSSSSFEASGWMKEVTDLRNEFMHRRPYGDRFIEQMGFVQPVDSEAGVYRYVRPLILKNSEDDVQSIILRHYREMTKLCYSAAMASGNDTSIHTLTTTDIISIEEND